MPLHNGVVQRPVGNGRVDARGAGDQLLADKYRPTVRQQLLNRLAVQGEGKFRNGGCHGAVNRRAMSETLLPPKAKELDITASTWQPWRACSGM